MEPAQPFRMPAEWEPHVATWIAWPHRRDDWPGKFAPIPWVYTEIVRHLHQSERVRILVNDVKVERQATSRLSRAGVDLRQVDFVHIPTDRSWTRDYGPMFVKAPNGERTVLDWKFNAWAKYTDWKRDDAVAGLAAMAFSVPLVQPDINGQRLVLEGGAIDVNGEGTVLTTEECLLSPIQERNPGVHREKLEDVLARFLGAQRVVWLGRGIAGDDTHGHIDDLARFVGPRTIVTVIEENPADVNFEPLQENLRRLKDTKFEIIPLPMPAPVFFKSQRLPASYANFYIANDRVLVPTFNDPKDRIALGILGDLFLTRQVVGIHAVDLVWGLGTIHCLTQQEPASGPI